MNKYEKFEIDNGEESTLSYWHNGAKYLVSNEKKGRGRFDNAVYWYLPDEKSSLTAVVKYRKKDKRKYINFFYREMVNDNDFLYYKKTIPFAEQATVEFDHQDQIIKNELGHWGFVNKNPS